jgi:DNA-binding Lrp family transcriptional regulator
LPKVLILIRAESGAKGKLAAKLKGTDGVTEVYEVQGDYDFFVKAEGDTMEKVNDAVTRHIRRLEEARSTLTMLVVE